MPADIINLRRARKERGKQAKERDAAANRTRFGMTSAEKKLRALTDEVAAKRLDGHHLTPKDDEA